MVQIRDDVRMARQKKADEWFAAAKNLPDGWKVNELVLASAIGYFVPKAFKSANGRNVTDSRVLELMMAQGYKPRVKKDSDSDSETSPTKASQKNETVKMDIDKKVRSEQEARSEKEEVPSEQEARSEKEEVPSEQEARSEKEEVPSEPEVQKKRKYTRKPKPNEDAAQETTLVTASDNKDALVEAINNLIKVMSAMVATR